MQIGRPAEASRRLLAVTEDYLVALNPLVLHERQMPKVLPLPMMFVQRFVMLASSAALKVAWMNGVAVRLKAPAAAPA